MVFHGQSIQEAPPAEKKNIAKNETTNFVYKYF
jgi:hypothetical protein